MNRLPYCIAFCFVATSVFAQIPKLEYGINFSPGVKWTDVDAAGSAYVAGVLESSENYGPDFLSSNGGRDVFILKVDPSGTILWAKSFGGVSDDEVNALKVDAGGNILLAGMFVGDVDFNPGIDEELLTSNSDSGDGYVLKLDTDGNFIWVRVFGDSEWDAVNGVASDASNDVYLTGFFSGEVDLDPTSGDHTVMATGGINNSDAFFVKLAADGSFAWAQTIGNAGPTIGVGVSVDFAGSPIFIGHYLDLLDVDPSAADTWNINSVGEDNNIFLLKLSSTGSFVFGSGFGSAGVNEANSVYADGQNNIYITGTFTAQGDFDPGAGETILTSTDETYDVFVMKLASTGGLLWAHAIGSTGDDWAYAIYANNSGVYVSGTFIGVVDFDPGPGTANEAVIDSEDAFILKLDGSGLFQWVGKIGDNNYEEGGSIVGDAAGNIYTSGQFFSLPTDIDPGSCELFLDPETEPSYLIKFGTTPSQCLTIYSQPVSITTCQGQGADFTVGASGVNVSYQWYTEDSEGNFIIALDDNTVYSGTQTATLSVNTSGLSPGTRRRFRVEVMGDGTPSSVDSNVTSLFVVGAPEAASVTRCGPGAATLKVTDAIPGFTYNWYEAAETDPISGATGAAYTTPSLTAPSTLYFVERDLGFCQGPRTTLTVYVEDCQPIPELVWANSIASSGRIADMHVDRTNGTLYVTGTYTGTSDFDPGPGIFNLAQQGSSDVFIGKYNTAGGLIWARNVGGTSQDDCNAITVDKDGNVIIAGYFRSTVDFDPGPGVFPLTSAGAFDIFILKLDPDGNFVWAKRIGGTPTAGDIASAVRTDASGNIYMAGSFVSLVDMDPGPGSVPVTAANYTDGVILKLAPNGDYMNSIILRGLGFDDFSDIEIDDSGNIYATGQFQYDTDFDPGAGTVNETGSNDDNAYVLKLNSTGGYVWHKIFSTAVDESRGYTIDIDGDGNIVVGGVFSGTLDLDPGTGVDEHLFLEGAAYTIKLDPAGNYIWGKTLRTSDSGFGFTAVNGTNVYMFGRFDSTSDLNPGTGTFNLTAAGQGDVFITKMDEDGAFQWALQMGGASLDALMTLGFDNAGNIYSGGYFSAPGDYDPGPNTFTLQPVGGSTSGSFVKLGVPSPALVITSQPVSANACVGGTVSFSVAATGVSNIQYHWQKYDDLTSAFIDVSDGTGYSGAAAATLSVNTTGNFGAGTYRCRVSGDGVTDVFSTVVTLAIVTALDPPGTGAASRCGPGSVTVNANGALNGNFRWYTSPTGTAIAGEINDSYTATISATTTFFVSIVSGACESTRSAVVATVNTIPTPPTAAGVTRCAGTNATLTASGGAEYRWYDVATGGSYISSGADFTTPDLNVTTTYYVSSVASSCESTRSAVTVTINNCNNNQPPVIASSTTGAEIHGTTTINLTTLISDPDNNLDMATLKIVVQPKSGALATIDQNGQLSLDYSGTSFSGEDELTIEVCDIAGSCVQQVITVNVTGEMSVYNAVSPNGDGKNDVFHIGFIDVLEDTRKNKVTIFNRWGDVVFEIEDYNNTTNVFRGNSKGGGELPSGTYYYRIEFDGPRKAEAGYLCLKR